MLSSPGSRMGRRLCSRENGNNGTCSTGNCNNGMFSIGNVKNGMLSKQKTGKFSIGNENVMLSIENNNNGKFFRENGKQ